MGRGAIRKAEGLSTRRSPPPLHQRVLAHVRGVGWRTAYFAEYQGKPRAVVHGLPGRWYADRWSPLIFASALSPSLWKEGE